MLNANFDCVVLSDNFMFGEVYEDRHSKYPIDIRIYGDNKSLSISYEEDATHYVYCIGEQSTITFPDSNRSFTLYKNMFAKIPGNFEIEGDYGIVISHLGIWGIFHLGGPIEEKGCLRYIDGASDTLLLHPDRFGLPCLNHLHFPPGIEQTAHTHPSLRINVVVRGTGECVASHKDGEKIYLAPGKIFLMPTHALHKFVTKDSLLDVITFHPDSDFGPSDRDHPMLNRTFVHGRSASEITEIHTQTI